VPRSLWSHGRSIMVALVALFALGWVRGAVDRYTNVGDETYLAQKNAGYRPLVAANDFTRFYGDRLVQIGLENGVYFFRGLVIGDHFGPGRYSQFLEWDQDRSCARLLPGDALLARVEAFGARMLAVSLAGNCVDRQQLSPRWRVLWESEGAIVLGLQATAVETP